MKKNVRRPKRSVRCPNIKPPTTAPVRYAELISPICAALKPSTSVRCKTALIAHFVAALDQSWPVLRGWCDPLAVPRPLGPLIDALEGLGAPAASAIGTAIRSGDIAALYARLLAVLRDGPPRVWVPADAVPHSAGRR